MGDVERLAIEGGEVSLLSTVQGLVAEAARVRAAFDAEAPLAAVALGVSPESAAALLRWEPPEEDVDLFEDLPDHDFVYSARLAEYGDIRLPPPDLLEAARLAAGRGVPLYGVDMPEEAYEEAFTREVGAFAFLRYGRVQRALSKRPPKAKDARAFSLAWDARIRKVRAIGRVEALREAAIAEGARALAAKTGGRVLLVVDAPRAAGVAERLRAPPGRLLDGSRP